MKINTSPIITDSSQSHHAFAELGNFLGKTVKPYLAPTSALATAAVLLYLQKPSLGNCLPSSTLFSSSLEEFSIRVGLGSIVCVAQVFPVAFTVLFGSGVTAIVVQDILDSGPIYQLMNGSAEIVILPKKIHQAPQKV